MRLGSSIRRRRFRLDGRFKWPSKKWWVGVGRHKFSRDAGVVLGGVLFFGFFFGYQVTTRLLFPMPELPRDLFEVPDVRGLELSAAMDIMSSVKTKAQCSQ